MKNQFIPWRLEEKLVELGFNPDHRVTCYDDLGNLGEGILWQQAFDWFREKQNLENSVYWSNNYKDYRFSVDNLTKIPNEGDLISMESKTFNTYEEAREACLEKLIQILEETK